MAGPLDCAFRTAAALLHADPLVASWSMLRNGRVRVTRTDIDEHIESDIFVVTEPFQVRDLKLQPGELIAYVRRQNGSELNAATEFQHLRRLP